MSLGRVDKHASGNSKAQMPHMHQAVIESRRVTPSLLKTYVSGITKAQVKAANR